MAYTSIEELYDAWRASEGEGAEELEAELADSYPRAWDSGDTTARLIALDFIFDTKQSKGFRLVCDGLASEDQAVAKHAGSVALALLSRGQDLGPDLIPALESFEQRWPSLAVLAQAAKMIIADREQQ